MAQVFIDVPPGVCVVLRLADQDGSLGDGEFEFHHDTPDHPNSIVVKETGGFSGSVLGGANEVLYHEHYGNVPMPDAPIPATPEPTLRAKTEWLRDRGYVVDSRHPSVRSGQPGKYMLTDMEFEGVGYAIVGDDIDALIDDAYSFLKLGD
jgi:hypothetical protein